MAQRWETEGGTDFKIWRADARNLTRPRTGLRTVEWVDTSYHIKWAVPLAGNEMAIGLDIRFDEEREEVLRGAADKMMPTVTPPLRLVQGYDAFIIYIPLRVRQAFDGFLVGIYSLEDLFGHVVAKTTTQDFAVSISYDGIPRYSNGITDTAGISPWSGVRRVLIYDREWELRLIPTRRFLEDHVSHLPFILLLSGIVIAVLSGLVLRYVQVTRVRGSRLQDSLRKLKEASGRNQAIMETVVDGLLTSNEDGLIESVNPAAREMLHASEAELVGRKVDSLFHSNQQGEGESLALWCRKILEPHEISASRSDGSRFPVEVSCGEMILDGRRAYLATFRDISKKLEMEKIKNEFVSTVSHELRTPLTSIRGSLGLILGAMSSGLSDNVKALLEVAQNNCERLILLINDILDMDKIAAGQMRFDLQRESLARLLSQSVEAQVGFAGKFGVKLELVNAPPQLELKTDSSRFVQVMANLISNAVKFSPEGGVVIIRSKVEDESVRVEVIDQGPGIPKEFQARVFEKFSQADSSRTRTRGGTGLGLHISQQIVEVLGGSIGFQSVPDEGTTFWLLFPLEAAQAAPNASEGNEYAE